jgi:ATP-binding cassette subfamily F protein uup
MNIITGRIQPDAGTVDIGSTIQIGYFDQHSDDVSQNDQQRVIDYLKNVAELIKTADGSVITASQMLERFLFPPNQQYAPIHKLSGGEKRRLFLLKVLKGAPNVLIFDEPTNDLDVQTLAVLEEYLEDFNGCVIVVSHDRYFLDRVVDTILALEPGGTIRQYPGNYSLYLETQRSMAAIAENQQTQSDQAATTATKKAEVLSQESSKAATKSRKLSYKETREYEQLEEQIAQMEANRENVEKRLYNHPPSDFTEMQQMTEQLAELTQQIERATERWLELAERAT